MPVQLSKSRIRLRVLPSGLPQNIELRDSGTAIEWRYVGQPDDAWQVLVEIDDIAATVEIGTVSTLAPGEAATVVNVGTARNVVLDIGIPAGSDGLVQTIDEGTGIEVDDTDPNVPIVGLTTAVQASLVLADTSGFATLALAEAYNPASPPAFTRIAGYTDAGDGGGALYRLVGSEPAHDGKYEDAAGNWYEIAESTVTPQMFGAVGDGVTSDQVAVAAAVAAAYAAGNGLYWPEGTYLTTASIANVHSVRHSGPGAIKRGSDLFYPDPSQNRTNIFYVATTGSSGNDGLSASEPLDSLNNALDRLKNYGPELRGTWKVSLAAGTYDGGAAFPYVHSLRKVQIYGPSKGGPRVTPDVLIQRGATSSDYGLFTGDATRVSISDISFEGFDLDSNSAGVRVGEFSDVTLYNVHSSNNTIGLFALTLAVYTTTGCVFEDNVYAGVHELYGVIRNTLATDTADRNLISGSEYGLKAKELCTGHFDLTEVTDCDHAVHLSRSCTMNSEDATYKRNGIVFAVGPGSSVVDEGVIYGTGADRNTVKWRFFQGVGRVTAKIENAVTGPYVGLVEKSMAYMQGANVVHTGTTSDTKVVDLGDSEAGDFQGEGSWYRYEARGTASLSATATLRIRVGGTGAIAITMPTGSYSWYFNGRIFARSNGTDTQRADGTLWVSSGNPVMSGGDRTIAFSTTALAHDLYVQLGNSADVVTVFQAMSLTTEM